SLGPLAGEINPIAQTSIAHQNLQWLPFWSIADDDECRILVPTDRPDDLIDALQCDQPADGHQLEFSRKRNGRRSERFAFDRIINRDDLFASYAPLGNGAPKVTTRHDHRIGSTHAKVSESFQ